MLIDGTLYKGAVYTGKAHLFTPKNQSVAVYSHSFYYYHPPDDVLYEIPFISKVSPEAYLKEKAMDFYLSFRFYVNTRGYGEARGVSPTGFIATMRNGIINETLQVLNAGTHTPKMIGLVDVKKRNQYYGIKQWPDTLAEPVDDDDDGGIEGWEEEEWQDCACGEWPCVCSGND